MNAQEYIYNSEVYEMKVKTRRIFKVPDREQVGAMYHRDFVQPTFTCNLCANGKIKPFNVLRDVYAHYSDVHNVATTDR